MNTTDNYKLPLYESKDNPNLIDGYNEGMLIVDRNMKQNSDYITSLNNQTYSALANGTVKVTQNA